MANGTRGWRPLSSLAGLLGLGYQNVVRDVIRRGPLFCVASAALIGLATAACPGTTPSTPDAGPASCAAPGKPTPGPLDTHCASPDGGAATVQSTSAASCHPDGGVGDAGASNACPYGTTMYGQESDDDDCKYRVKWSSTPICEGAGGVTITVVVTKKTDNSPLTGAGTVIESFTTSPADASCDDQSNHPGPNSGVLLTEGPPGTYTGPVVFDTPGQWTIRFHFHGECADLLPDSPHGHAAYHLTVP
jgi:hypothetical protein